MAMIAMSGTVSKPIAAMIDLREQGYTIRRGVYIPRRGFPRGQFQLFNPAGEFVKVVDRRLRDELDAAAVDMCFVACGRLDGYFEENLHDWDIAAGDLIAREAGCLTGDFHGGPIRPAETMTASPAIFASLGELIVQSTTTDQQ